MLQTPTFNLAFPIAKLDISRLLESSPSPPPPPLPSQARPSLSRETSVAAATISHRASTSSNVSTTSTYAAASSTASNPQHSIQLQAQLQSQRQPLPPLASISAQAQLPPLPPHPHPPSKRPPPTSTHPSASPAKRQSKWSPEEDALIIELRGSNMKWEDISKRLPGRSAISCRLHYQNYLERRSEWDEEKKNRLARLYERLKQEIWTPLAQELGIPWRAAEAMHWQIGEAEMARRAGVSPFSLSNVGAGAGVGVSTGGIPSALTAGPGPGSGTGFPAPSGYIMPTGGGGVLAGGYGEGLPGQGPGFGAAPPQPVLRYMVDNPGIIEAPKEKMRDMLSIAELRERIGREPVRGEVLLPSVAELERGLVAFDQGCEETRLEMTRARRKDLGSARGSEEEET